MEQLRRHHERELQRLQQEKERLLDEERAATVSGEDQEVQGGFKAEVGLLGSDLG